jgi:glycosyltransferase involved in cell wall biosynthesis
MAEPLILYYQPTLGPAHIERIRALDCVGGLRCRGVQLASREATRAFELGAGNEELFTTLLPGVYERLPRLAILRAARKHILECRPAAIIIDAPADPVQWALGQVARRAGAAACTRWAATWWDHPRKRWKEIAKGFVYRGWDAYLVTGERGVEYLRTFGVPQDRIFVCGNPVAALPIEKARIAAGSRIREASFLFVGRFLRLKNLERFASAYRRYREAGGSWSLQLVGFGESEPAVREALSGERLAVFHGHLQQSELIELYLRCGCLVLPSYSENWGLVVSEAMHAGMPVLVSTRSGCYPELVHDGENGFGLDAYDEHQMAMMLARFSALPAGERDRMGSRSLAIIEPHSAAAWAHKVRKALVATPRP